MNVTLAEHWSDPTALAILAAVSRAAAQVDIRYCVVGASARNLVMTGVHGLALTSATKDIDFAVAVGSWEAYQQLQSTLIDSGEFAAEASRQHLLRYLPGGGYPLDLIPYGGVTDANDQLAWPPMGEPVMNQIGYPEVVDNALLLELPGGVLAPVASLPGFVLLKLFAWGDRWAQTRRDATDVATLMRDYQRVPAVCDWLYGDGIHLMEATRYDLDLASIMMLGADVRRLAANPTAHALRALLADDAKRARLISHMDTADALGIYRVGPEAALEWFERGMSSQDS